MRLTTDTLPDFYTRNYDYLKTRCKSLNYKFFRTSTNFEKDDDIINDIYVALHKNLSKKPDGIEVPCEQSYLYIITRNFFIKRYHRRKRDMNLCELTDYNLHDEEQHDLDYYLKLKKSDKDIIHKLTNDVDLKLNEREKKRVRLIKETFKKIKNDE